MPAERPDVAAPATTDQERLFVASQWQLMWWKFRRHRLAIASGIVILLLYLVAAFCEFLAPDDPFRYNADYTYAPPQRIRFHDGQRLHLRPFVYGVKTEMDKVRNGGKSELMDILIAREWAGMFRPFTKDPAALQRPPVKQPKV